MNTHLEIGALAERPTQPVGAALRRRARRQPGARRAALGRGLPGSSRCPTRAPTKWHLAHTTWFFETLVLGPAGDPPFDPAFGYLFNSYYEAIGPRHPRPRRGMLSRPRWPRCSRYRANVDQRVLRAARARRRRRRARALVELGLHHEQQHQELILTDIQHALVATRSRPALPRARWPSAGRRGRSRSRWVELRGRPARVGHDGARRSLRQRDAAAPGVRRRPSARDRGW